MRGRASAVWWWPGPPHVCDQVPRCDGRCYRWDWAQGPGVKTRGMCRAPLLPPRVPPARSGICASGFLYPHQRSRDARGSPQPLAVPGRPRRGRAHVLAGGAPAGTSLWPGVSPDGGDSMWQVPEPGWEQRRGVGEGCGQGGGDEISRRRGARERPSAPGGRPGATGGKGTGGLAGEAGAGQDRGCSRQNKQVGVG